MSGIYTFKWAEPANEVFVTGDFDDWKKTLPLVKQTNGTFLLTVPLELKKDKIQYKFVVDDEWKVDNSARVEHDSTGHVNNVLLKSDLYTGDSVPESGLPVNMAAANAQPAQPAGDISPEVLPKDPAPNLLGTPGPVMPANASEIKEFQQVSTVDPKSLNPEQPAATTATATSDSVSTSSEKKKKKKKSKDKKKSSEKKKKSSTPTPTSTAAVAAPGDTPSATTTTTTAGAPIAVAETPKEEAQKTAPAPIAKDKGKEAPATTETAPPIAASEVTSVKKQVEEPSVTETATKPVAAKEADVPPAAPKKDTAPNTPSKSVKETTAAAGEADGQKQVKKKKGFWYKVRKALS